MIFPYYQFKQTKKQIMKMITFRDYLPQGQSKYQIKTDSENVVFLVPVRWIFP